MLDTPMMPDSTETPPKPPMRFRKTRIAASVFFVLLTVALCVLWVQSYLVREFYEWSSKTHNYSLFSNAGEISIQRSLFFSGPFGSHGGSLPVMPDGVFHSSIASPLHRALGVSWSEYASGWYVGVSYWLAVLVSVVLAIIPWKRWSKRFSLRTILIATTLGAIVLGLVTWSTRR